MKSILMATDLSGRSDRALERAVALARDRGSALIIVHVVDGDLPSSLADAQQEAAEQTIQEHIDTLTAGNGPNTSIEVVVGRAHVDILQMSEQVEAGLIVLGMHREDAFKDMFRGTTVERVIRAANAPVLLVKEPVRGPYRGIMVAVDFSVYSRRAIEYAITIAPEGEFDLVHAYEIPFKAFLYGDDTRKQVEEQHKSQLIRLIDEEMKAFLSGINLDKQKIHCFMQEGGALEVIHRRADEIKPDLLVVGTHGRTGVSRAVFGSVAEDLLRSPPCDVVAVKAW